MISQINKIANRINDLINSNQIELHFLFGAGINFNIAKNSLSWHKLASNVVEEYVGKRKLSKFEKESVSKMIISKILNPKILLSLGEPFLNNISVKPREEISWFRNGYNKIFSKVIPTILTLNYDRVIEDALSINGKNILTNPTIEKNTVLHLHGMTNPQGKISDKRLLTITDYVENIERVEGFLKEVISKPTKQTMIIIGTSLEEEHILKSLKNNNNNDIKIYFVHFILKDCKLKKEIIDIYKKLNIEIIDINILKNPEDSFKLFWTELSKSISKNIFKGSDDFKTPKEIFVDDLKLYNYLKLKYKNVKLEEIENDEYLKSRFVNLKSPVMARPLFWLKNDKIISTEDYLNWFLNLTPIPISYFYQLNKFDINKIKKDQKEKIAKIINEKINDNDKIQLYILDNFLQNNDMFKLLMEYDDIRNMVAKRIMSKFERFNDELEKNILNHITIDDFSCKNSHYTHHINTNQYPTINNNFIKIINNSKETKYFKNNKTLNENIENIIFNIYGNTRFDRYVNLGLLSIKGEESIKKYEEIIEKFFNNLKNWNTKEGQSKIYDQFIKITFLYINSQKSQEYINKIKNYPNFPIEVWPSDIDYLGRGGSSTPNYHLLDGRIIKETNESFKNIYEAIIFIKTNEIIKYSDIKKIINTIPKKEIKIEKDIQDILHLIILLKSNLNQWIFKKIIVQDGPIATIIFDSWKKYSDFINEILNNDIDIYDINEKINIITPMNIYRALDLAIQDEDTETLILIMKTLRKNYYNKENLFFNEEIKYLIRKNKDEKNAKEYLIEILSKNKLELYENIILNQEEMEIKNIEGLYCYSLFMKDYNSLKLEEVKKIILDTPIEKEMKWINFIYIIEELIPEKTKEDKKIKFELIYNFKKNIGNILENELDIIIYMIKKRFEYFDILKDEKYEIEFSDIMNYISRQDINNHKDEEISSLINLSKNTKKYDWEVMAGLDIEFGPKSKEEVALKLIDILLQNNLNRCNFTYKKEELINFFNDINNEKIKKDFKNWIKSINM